MEAARKLEREKCHFFATSGHGIAPYISPQTAAAILQAAPTMCQGFIEAENEPNKGTGRTCLLPPASCCPHPRRLPQARTGHHDSAGKERLVGRPGRHPGPATVLVQRQIPLRPGARGGRLQLALARSESRRPRRPLARWPGGPLGLPHLRGLFLLQPRVGMGIPDDRPPAPAQLHGSYQPGRFGVHVPFRRTRQTIAANSPGWGSKPPSLFCTCWARASSPRPRASR